VFPAPYVMRFRCGYNSVLNTHSPADTLHTVKGVSLWYFVKYVTISENASNYRINWNYMYIMSHSRSLWPAQTLGLWARIPLQAWMSVCVYSVFVLIPRPRSRTVYKRLRNWKSEQGPTKGCRATDEWIMNFVTHRLRSSCTVFFLTDKDKIKSNNL
jgi:hypothetical protein